MAEGEEKKRETNPEVIGIYLKKALEEQLGNATQTRAGLVPEKDRITIILEGKQLYDTAVRTIYNTLCQLNVGGCSSIDKREIEEFRRGLENYLFPKK